MTVAFKVGRVAENIPATGEILSWASSGPAVTADVEYALGTFNDAQAVVAQLLGLQEHGLPAQVVPLVWDESPTRTGFYRVDSVDVNLDRRWIRSNVVRASLGLTRIAGGSGLAGEHILWGADRASTPIINDWVGDPPQPWVAWPDTWRDAIDLTGAGITVLPGLRAVTSNPPLRMNVVTYIPYDISVLTGVTPETFYDGACEIRTGNPSHVVTGRHEGIDPEAFEVGNGLIKIVPPSATDRVFNMRYRLHDGAAWGARDRAVSIWQDGTYTSPTWDMRPVAVTVIRNSPELAVVRLTVPIEYPNGVAYLDVSLRRGSRFIGLSLTTAVASNWAVGHRVGFNGAWGGIDSPAVGAVQTNADVDGHHPLILLGSVQVTGITFNSSGRVINGGTYRSLEVAVGSAFTNIVSGDVPSYVDEADKVQRQYFAAMGETFRVVQQ